MSLQIRVGPSAWDAVTYVRGLIEDTTSPYVIPDSVLIAYAEDVNEDISRHLPLDYVVGNVYAQTSPLVTVIGQTRYVCSTANGFTAPPITITDALYAAGTGYSAASEIAYMALLPFSPVTRFISVLDSPSERVLRDSYMDEISRYGHGYFKVVRDPLTGLFALDLYPTPTISGTPIYVRYTGAHVMTLSTDSQGNQILAIPTIPENNKRDWAKLLYALVLEEEGGRIIKAKQVKTGMIEVGMDSRMIEQKVIRIKEEVTASLGGFVGVVIAS